MKRSPLKALGVDLRRPLEGVLKMQGDGDIRGFARLLLFMLLDGVLVGVRKGDVEDSREVFRFRERRGGVLRSEMDGFLSTMVTIIIVDFDVNRDNETKEWNVSTQRVKREDQGCERARLRTLHGVHGNVSVTIWRSDISQYVAVSRPAKIIIFTFMCNTWKRARRAASQLIRLWFI